MTFDDYGAIPLRIEALDPPRVVAYRWSNDDALGVAAAPSRPRALDRLPLHPRGRRRRHPAHRRRVGLRAPPTRSRASRATATGWDSELDELVAYSRALVTTATLVPVFAALGDETRWSILAASARATLRPPPSPGASRSPARRSPSTSPCCRRSASSSRPGGREVRYRVLGPQLSETAQRLDAIGAEWDRRLAAIKRIAEGL